MSSISSLISSNYSSSSGASAINVSSILAATYGSSSAAIDVSAAVSAAIYSARAPERVWESEITTFTTQTKDLNSIQSATESIVTDLQNLNTMTGVLASRTVTSSNSSYIKATAAAGTESGTHAIHINQVATKEAWYTDTEASASATLPDSVFTITTNSGSTVSFSTGSSVSGGDTLTHLAATLNSASMGITATVVADADGAKLAIVSNSTGAANGFSIDAADFSGSSWTSQTLSSDSTLGENTITITGTGTGAPSLSVATTSGETYDGLVTAINNAISAYNSSATTNGSATLNVTAKLVSGSSGSYFTLVSTDSSSFTLNQPAFSMSEAVTAANAKITVDGVPVSSATNTVTGAISGVTMYLYGAYSGAEFDLTVAPDVASVTSAINQFVSDYNSVAEMISTEYTLTSTSDSSGSSTVTLGALASDPTLSSFQLVMQGLLTYVASSTTSSSGGIATLYQLGINVTDGGTLSVDSSMLSGILTNSADAVQAFFQGDALNGFAQQSYSSLYIYTSPSNGAFKVDLSSISTQSSDIEEHITDFENGYISSQIVMLTAQFTKAEQALESLSQTMKQVNALLFPSSSS